MTAGQGEITFFTLEGGTSAMEAIFEFELPVTLGNTLGGLLFVALPNFFQTRGDRFREWKKMSWRDWILGRREPAGHED